MIMDVLECEKPKLAAAKRLSDHDLKNTFQRAAKKPRRPVNHSSSPSPPCGAARDHFTYKDLHRLLFSQCDMQAISVKQPAVAQQNECFWCDASSANPNFQCPQHKHDKAANKQIPQLPLALRSLPPEVGLCTSTIPGEGCGVYAKRKIPAGAWIGPYEGNSVKPEELSSSTDTTYMWEIFEEDKLAGYIDGSDVNVTSWMRFIRCARHKQEQNLFAFQYLGKIFYRAFKAIPPGEELLVWYDDKYPQYLGIPWTIFDMGAQIPRGSSSRYGEIIVVSPHEKDSQPLKISTRGPIFPSPPPSPLSNSSIPLTPVSISLNGKRNSQHLPRDDRPFYMKSVPLEENLLKQMTTKQPKYFSGEKRTLSINSVSETTTEPHLWSRGQSPKLPHRDISAQVTHTPHQ